MSFHVPNQFRYRDAMSFYGSDDSIGNYGVFFVPTGGRVIKTLASEGLGWEHVSASHEDRCPTWLEMCLLKALFWDAEDVVIQYHPAKSEYVNLHPYTLHLWRPIGVTLPTPPKELIG